MLALGTVATLIAGMLPKGTAQAAITTAKEFNGHYYQVITDAKTFQQAEIQSEVIGAHLVTITSEEEQQFVHSLSGTDDVWLGAVYQNGAWKWVTGESFSYTNWMKGQPSDPENAPYAQFWKGKGEWDDAWDHENAYVMEWESEADYREKKQKLLNLRLYN